MEELGRTALEARHEHLQNLVSQGCITVAELVTLRVPEDLAFPTLVGRYVTACMVFYELGFSMPSQQFLCSLLQF
jgi:hypothetical protein